MKAIKNVLRRIFGTRSHALDKRRLERLLRAEGLSRKTAARVTHAFFGKTEEGGSA